jgi:hypothetical protein
MRTLIFGAILLVTTIAGLYPLVSSSVASVRNARAATFSDRFAPVLDQMKEPLEDSHVNWLTDHAPPASAQEKPAG